MLTLKAAGLLDVDAGEIVRPGILKIEDDRIAGVAGESEGDIIDLGDQILLPGLMDMEVNLLMGGRGETPGLSQVQDDPPTRVLRGRQCPAHAARRVHHGAQPGPVRQDRRLPA
ncbi:hypothetical protein MSTO_47440 [Mycobacterium stomatepiae]|uniref:Amidohydrolase n=1 Tax=Mycobacterium stomatepiae TaxID=470076 RepID=A0A7I7QE29_9MYCO|nr:hypothetical protein MSTO_47440 [Mycobacterium stomatepiae]